MNPWPAFWRDLCGVIRQAWPEVGTNTNPIFRITQVQMIPWRTNLQAGKLLPPWVPVSITNTQQIEDQGASNIMYRPRVTVFYVTQLSGLDIASVVESKLSDLEAVFVQHDYTGFQCFYGFAMDVSEDNPVNATFSGSNIPMFGGSLSVNLQFGYVVTP